MLIVAPTLMIQIWPWQLTPLTARVLGGWFALPGVVALAVAIDRRWSASRIVLQSQMFGLALILVAAARAWDQFDRSNVITWLFLAGIAGLLVLIAAAYATTEYRRQPAWRDRKT